ncbi:hypothetical protein [Elizabethkingia phage TCUEAP1]|nr:hypothetical protein [Elizabethkingia phage TCUEAP1]
MNITAIKNKQAPKPRVKVGGLYETPKGAVVVCIGFNESETSFSGVVVYKAAANDFHIGEYSDSWSVEYCKPFYGEVIIKTTN